MLSMSLTKFCIHSQGREYIQKVRECQMSAIARGLTTCSLTELQGISAVAGGRAGDNCFWQDGQFCQVIGNQTDCQVLYRSVHGTDFSSYW